MLLIFAIPFLLSSIILPSNGFASAYTTKKGRKGIMTKNIFRPNALMKILQFHYSHEGIKPGLCVTVEHLRWTL